MEKEIIRKSLVQGEIIETKKIRKSKKEMNARHETRLEDNEDKN